MLTFDPDAHVYRWEGRVVPNVTRIIASLTDYSGIPPAVLERARLEGQHVHHMADLHFKGDLDAETLPEWMKGHHVALLRFEAECGFECWESESRVYHRALGYAGTLDQAGRLKLLKTSKRPAVIDVKRSFYAGPAIGLQTVAYAEGWNSEFKKDQLHERYALQLKPDGSYRLLRYDDQPKHKEDRTAFLACLQQLRWKEKHYGSK